MNKEQSADDPSVDLIRVKNMLNSTIYELPDKANSCIEHKVFHDQSNWGSVAHIDNNMKDYSHGWLITITAIIQTI